MKIKDFKPGRRVFAGNFGPSLICDGILSKEIKIGSYENRYYIRGCIIKLNGRKSWWPLSWIHYVSRK